MKLPSLLIVSLILLVSCKSNVKPDGIQQKIYYVNSAKVPCTGVGEQQCLEIQKGNAMVPGQWELFYDTIEGFDYKPGYISKIVVKEEKLSAESVPADASNMKYTLVSVLSQKGDDLLKLNDIWALKEINGNAVELLEGNKQPTIEINIAERRIGGTDSCNNYFGDIETISKEKITFSGLGGTLMACPDMMLSENFKDALEGTASYERRGSSLEFKDAEGNTILKFRKVD